MSRRRTPLGTQPPVAATEPSIVVSGTIEPKPRPQSERDPRVVAHEKALEADQEHAVIVQIDDDWLERLELPID
jgi:hypothetical protein